MQFLVTPAARAAWHRYTGMIRQAEAEAQGQLLDAVAAATAAAEGSKLGVAAAAARGAGCYGSEAQGPGAASERWTGLRASAGAEAAVLTGALHSSGRGMAGGRGPEAQEAEGRGGDAAAVKRRRLDGADTWAGRSAVGTGVVCQGSHRGGAHAGSVGQGGGGGGWGGRGGGGEGGVGGREGAGGGGAAGWGGGGGEQAGEEVEEGVESKAEDEELRLDTVGAVCVDAAGGVYARIQRFVVQGRTFMTYACYGVLLPCVVYCKPQPIPLVLLLAATRACSSFAGMLTPNPPASQDESRAACRPVA